MYFYPSGVLGSPFTDYTYLIIAAWAVSSSFYAYFFLIVDKLNPGVRTVVLIVILSLEMLLFALLLGTVGLLLSVVIMFITVHFLNRRIVKRKKTSQKE